MIDEDAFADFYREFRPRLARYAASQRADDPEGTADLALFDLHRALRRGSFESDAAARAYVYRAVRSRVAGEFRKPVPVPVPFDEDDLRDRTWGDEGQAVVDRDAIGRLLDGLNDAQRQVLLARYVEDLTAEEVARRTERSAEAVYQLQRRGLTNLRRVAPTALLLVLIVVAGLVLMAAVGRSATVSTDPIERPTSTAPATPDERGEGSADDDGAPGGESGLGIVTEDGLRIVETAPGEQVEPPDSGPISGGDGTDTSVGSADPLAVGNEATTGGSVAEIPPTTSVATTTSTTTTTSTATTASTTTTTPVDAPPTTSPATTLAPFDWLIEPRNVARLRFEHSGLCLDAPGDSIGAVVVQRPCQAGGTQDIELVPRGNGNAARVVHSRLCLGPQGNALVEGAVIVQQECTGEPWQVFEIPGGALKFWDEDLCYAVEDDSTAEGARLVLARCTEGPTQRFSGA